MVRYLLVVAVLLLVITTVHSSESAAYDGYKVFRIVPKDEKNLQFVMFLHKKSELYGLDFWKEPSSIGNAADIMVAAGRIVDFLRLLKNNAVPYSVMIDDVGALLDAEDRHRSVAAFSTSYDHTIFNTYDAIVDEMKNLAEKFPSVAKVINLGYSAENRSLLVVKLSTGPGKQTIWIDCGIHAREWISPATCMFMIDYLLKQNGNVNIVSSLLNKYDWVIMPTMNPDGYAHTFLGRTQRMWRKNTSTNKGSVCKGTDLNRNWDHQWSTGVGTSSSPCSDVYKGQSAFSEKETAAVAKYLLTLKGSLKAYFTLHSYSQMWMTPWGYTDQLPADYAELVRVAKVGVDAIKKLYGTVYTYGSPGAILYKTSASSDDWAYDKVKPRYVYCLELRDNGLYGFLLPPSQIIPTAKETTEGILAAVEQML